MLLCDVCLSVMYIGRNSRTERPRKTKIGTEVAHVTRDSDTTFKVRRSRSPGRFVWLFKSLHNLYGQHHNLRYRPERAAACRSWIFMAQGVLGAAGVRRIWAGAGLQRVAYRGGGILRGFPHSLLNDVL